MNELIMRLPPDPMSVKTARGLLDAELERAGRASVAPDAALLVTELVCNAVMHARTAIVLHVTVTDEGVRVEVDDGSSELPAWSPAAPDAISGRGLTLVNALASRWGASTLPGGGKTVWFELLDLGEGEIRPVLPGLTAQELVEQWAALGEQAEPDGIPIVLPEVSAELLLRTRDHSDNLIREYQLLLLNYEARGATDAHAAAYHVIALARRLAATAEEFASGRRQLRAAALTALSRGEERVIVHLRLPASAAGAAERYRDAIEEAEEHCLTGSMLVHSSDPHIRERRTWYLTEIATQLRNASHG